MASHDPQTRTETARDRRRRPLPPPFHPTPDPTIITAPPSTLQNISQRFSKLYANHKKVVVSSMPFKPHSAQHHPPPETYFQQKPISYSPLSDTSCTTLTKSSSHNGRNSLKAKPRDKDSAKNVPRKAPYEEFDLDKAKKFTPNSIESSEEMKERIQAQPPNGFEVGRRSSVSSMVAAVSGGVGRRKSFCNSMVELADFLSCNGVKVVAVDMPPFMQIHAVDCARKSHDSLEKFTSKALALTLKKEFDGAYGPAWHCIVGTSFGSFVTHSVGGFMYFSMDHKLYILLFKTNVQRAE